VLCARLMDLDPSPYGLREKGRGLSGLTPSQGNGSTTPSPGGTNGKDSNSGTLHRGVCGYIPGKGWAQYRDPLENALS